MNQSDKSRFFIGINQTNHEQLRMSSGRGFFSLENEPQLILKTYAKKCKICKIHDIKIEKSLRKKEVNFHNLYEEWSC